MRGNGCSRFLPPTGIFVRGDVTCSDDAKWAVRAARENFGLLDVYNAGIIRPQTVRTFAEENWDRVMAVNVKSINLMCRDLPASSIRCPAGAW